MSHEPAARIFCSVPGCVEPAEGAVLFAYVKERRNYLCHEHIRPIRYALLNVISEPEASAAELANA